jgi:hypothetical protein
VNAIRYILTNPIGWGIAIVHWIVVSFAFLGDWPLDPLGFGVHSTTELMFYLVMLDFPALMLTKLLVSPFEPSILVTPLISIIPIALISLQWLLVGVGVTKLYSKYRKTMPIDGDGGVKLR